MDWHHLPCQTFGLKQSIHFFPLGVEPMALQAQEGVLHGAGVRGDAAWYFKSAEKGRNIYRYKICNQYNSLGGFQIYYIDLFCHFRAVADTNQILQDSQQAYGLSVPHEAVVSPSVQVICHSKTVFACLLKFSWPDLLNNQLPQVRLYWEKSPDEDIQWLQQS